MSSSLFAYAIPSGDRLNKIFAIALPIMGGMASQNVLNIVDTAMVGTLGDVALAATGMGGFANFMAISFILGLASGVQAIAARRLGQKRHSETAHSLNGGLLLALVIGAPATVVIINYAPEFFALLVDDAAVVAEGSPYLQIRVLAMIGVGMNFAFRGFWSAMHMTQLYMRTLLIMHALNIFLNWVLIFGNLGAPELGVFGAGLATTISIYTGTAIYFFLALGNARQHGFMDGLPSRENMATIIRVALPNSIQQLFFATGMVALFWIVGKIGVPELAAVNVLMMLALVALLPSMGLGIAAATLIGNALGQKDAADAKQWGWNVAVLGALLGVFLGGIMVIFHDPILGVFIHDMATLDLSVWPVIIMGSMIWVDGAAMVLMHAQLGAGDSRRMMIVTLVTQWLMFLPVAYLVGPVLGMGLLAVWVAQSIYRLVQALAIIYYWKKGHWAHIEV